MGVTIGDTPNGVMVVGVIPKGPADQAGLKKDDIITHINGKPVQDQKTLTDNTKNLKPGMTVKLTVKRGEEVLEKSVTLGRLVTPSTQQRDMLNAMGVGMSRRHDDFPVVLQHDSVLRPVDCGSPLVTLDGKTVGVNIARGGRTETYCVPTNALIMLMYDLMSGRKRPQEAVKPEEEKKPAAEAKKDEPAPEGKPKPEADPKAKEKPESKPEPKVEPKPDEKAKPKTDPKPEEKAEPKAEPKPEATPTPDVKPAPKAESKPDKKSEPKVEPKPEEKPLPKPEAKPEAKPEPTPEVEPKPEEKSAPKAETVPEKKPEPKPEPETQPDPAPDSQPVPEPETKPDSPEKTGSENGAADRDDFLSDKKAETEARSPQPTPVGKPVAI
ncbi:MAG TPA: hypothetical protein DD670_17585 [Planctomycetaceae bacterium]|nr:hypothetical protein [Planctomycetaceae bacterium]